MRLQHIKNLLDRVEDIEWLSEALNIDTKKYPELSSEKIKKTFWKMLEEKKLKDKFKVYIGEWE
jgi:hypothetical protein